MPQFQYKARKTSGEIVEGVLEADNRNLVVSRLQAMRAFPISVVERSGAGKGALGREVSLKSLRRISRRDTANFTRQMSDLLRSGLTLARALGVLIEQIENERFKEVIKSLRSDVQGGASFADALAKHPKHFPDLFVSMIHAGEVGGLLDEVLERLADFAEEELEIRGRVMTALAYPLIMVFVGIGVIIVLLTFVIPRFVTLFEEMEQELPLATLILKQASELFLTWWPILVLAVVGLVVLYKRLMRDPAERLRVDQVKLNLPVYGGFILKNEVARFARTLGVLLANGVNILKALDITKAVAKNGVIAHEISEISDNIREGERLSERLKESGIFPPVAVNMVAVGEETGSLEQTLLRVATTYERETERTLKLLTTLLEPAMILLMGAVVGFIVVSMIMPILKLSQGLE